MKTVLLLVAFLATALESRAQVTYDFIVSLSGLNEVSPNNSLGSGSGSFTLSGNLLTGGIFLANGQASFFPTSAGIYGPAPAGATGGLIFDLGNYLTVAPSDGDPGGKVYRTSLTLTGQQQTDLIGGLDYVNVTSGTFPGGEIRGQILAVPEPSTYALCALGLTGLLLGRRRMTAA